MLAADSGHDSGNMPVAQVEGFPEVAVVPGDPGQAALKGGNGAGLETPPGVIGAIGKIEADGRRVPGPVGEATPS